MTPVFGFHSGSTPLLVSVPHDGRNIPSAIRSQMTTAGKAIPDTDWHVAELYDFVREMGASTIIANYSRYVVDLNRPADNESLYPGQLATGVCPQYSFAGEAIYSTTSRDQDETAQRIQAYWQPYHDQIRNTLSALREQHGFALLWDAHSIPSTVPRLFDGELPELNLGSFDGASCGGVIERRVAAAAIASDFSAVVNGRFKGGYITRHYGVPEKGVHALQLEIAQRAYMDETSLRLDADKSAVLRATLRKLLDAFVAAARVSRKDEN